MLKRRSTLWLPCFAVLWLASRASSQSHHTIQKRAFYDNSILNYHSQRTCWWNEVCKREFQSNFLCRCPRYAYCRSPGRYYNAYCSLTSTGYIWMQPLAESGR